MKKINIDPHYWVEPGKEHKVSDFKTHYTAGIEKKNAEKLLTEDIKTMNEIQDIFYANNQYSLLIIFQAMDAAGKDGTIKHVMSGINPQGCVVTNFKQPSTEELNHDYFWRAYKNLPQRGIIGIFDRSYYEEILVTKVHPEIILNQHLPQIKTLEQITKSFWHRRYRQINDIEKHLIENGTLILKFFLNVSFDEQKKRFVERIDNKEKNWKLSPNDIKERTHWNEYMNAYSEMLSHTSTGHSPWYVIPADNKWFMRYIVSRIIIEQLQQLDLSYPKVSEETSHHLQELKEELLKPSKTQ